MDQTLEGKFYINGSLQQSCMGIKDGKIVAIKKTLKAPKHLTFRNKLILPAGIDLHVHFRDPGFTSKEDFSTGSIAAAYGGITCVFDMPNTNPLTTTLQTLLDKKSLAGKKSVVDFGVYAALNNSNASIVDDLASHCSGFKVFMGDMTQALHIDDGALKEALPTIAKSGKLLLVHAEDYQCLLRHHGSAESLSEYLLCRPAVCEESALRKVLLWCQQYPIHVHVCHLSSCEGFELLQGRPPSMSVGVTPHHLFFDVKNITKNQAFYKVNPPLRTSLDRETLWSGLVNRRIDLVESDHAPHTVSEKEDDFSKAPSGMPGVETLYPLLLAAVNQRRLGLERAVSLLCEKPADVMKIQKGRIAVGCDADVIVVDLKSLSTIKSEDLHSKCGWSPYDRFSAVFPTDVFVRGERIIEDKVLLVKPGFGKSVGVS